MVLLSALRLGTLGLSIGRQWVGWRVLLASILDLSRRRIARHRHRLFRGPVAESARMTRVSWRPGPGVIRGDPWGDPLVERLIRLGR